MSNFVTWTEMSQGEHYLMIFFGLIVVIPFVASLIYARKNPVWIKSMKDLDKEIINYKGKKMTFICNPNDEKAKTQANAYQVIADDNLKKGMLKEDVQIIEETFTKMKNGYEIDSNTEDELVIRLYSLAPKI